MLAFNYSDSKCGPEHAFAGIGFYAAKDDDEMFGNDLKEADSEMKNTLKRFCMKSSETNKVVFDLMQTF